MEFDCAGYGNISMAKCALKGITSALPSDSGVTAAVSGNKVILTCEKGYTLKKDQKIVDLAFEITELYKDGSGKEKWPLNVPAKINLTSFKMVSSSGSEIELSKLFSEQPVMFRLHLLQHQVLKLHLIQQSEQAMKY